MNCPNCDAPNSVVMESRLRCDNAMRRRRRCEECGHRWSTLERVFTKIPHPLKGQRVQRLEPHHHPRKLTDEQAVAIFHAKDQGQTMKALAERYGVSRETIRGIWRGRSRVSAIRNAGKVQLCTDCAHWRRSYCAMGFPDPEDEGPAFARDCSLYADSTQATSRDCPTSVQ